MIESLSIRNFQKHQKLEIDLDPVCTTFVGKTDSGKSACIRALRWLCQNKPSGDEFIREGSKRVGVAVDVDGQHVSRSKGSDNLYTLGKQQYKAFGNSVPDPVAKLLNVSDINFQGQFDPPFWLADSPGEVSRRLNAIVNLGVMDASLAYLSAESRKAAIRAELAEQRLKKSIEERNALKWVPEFVTQLEALEAQELAIEQKRRKRQRLAFTLQEIRSAQAIADNASPAILEGLAAVEIGKRIAERQKTANALRTLLRSIKEQDEKICQLKSDGEALRKRIDAVKNCPLCGAIRTPG